MSKSISIVIADDNKFFLEALSDSLKIHDQFQIIKAFNNLDDLTAFTALHNFDVLILDINFNGKSSLDMINLIKPPNKSFKIIALTTLNNNFFRTLAINSGIDYFIGKDSDFSNFNNVILDCYKNKAENNFENSSKVVIDNVTLTLRKIEILQSLYQYSGNTEKEIADFLFISESALKTHKRELFEITNVKNTNELIKFGIENGLVLI